MKSFITSVLFLFFAFHLNAQKWIWVTQGKYENTVDPFAIAADSAGNVFEAGMYLGSGQFGPYSLTPTSTTLYRQAFLVKYDRVGKPKWAKNSVDWAGETGAQAEALGLATDGKGNVYSTGLYNNDVAFGSYGFYALNGCGNVAYLTKYDSNGNVKWVFSATQNSCNSNSWGFSATTDNMGNVYMAGYFTDSVQFGTVTLQNGLSIANVFLAKFDTKGNLLWVTTPVQAYDSKSLLSYEWTGLSIITDPAGNVYFTGPYIDNVKFGAYDLASNLAGTNFFLVKYSSSGNVIWAKTGVLPSETCGAISKYNPSGDFITIDQADNIYVTGTYADSIQIGSYLLTGGEGSLGGAFLAKYDSSGNVIWAKSSASSSPKCGALAFGISADRWGYLYWSGTFQDTVNFGGMNLVSDSSAPSYLVKIDTGGHAVCGTFVDNINDDNDPVVADPVAPDVYFTGDLGSLSYSLFGKDTINGFICPPFEVNCPEFDFMAKWACDTCGLNIHVKGNTLLCQGQSTTLAANGVDGFYWSNGSATDSITVSPITTTTYSVTASNGICFGDTSIIIKVVSKPTISATQKICSGNTVHITVAGGSGYKWNNGDTTSTISVSPDSSVTYIVVVSYGSCTSTDSSGVIVYPNPSTTISNTQSICSGKSVILSATGGSAYKWSNGDTTSSITVSPDSNGIYFATISNGLCSVKDSVIVLVTPIPITACCDTSIAAGKSVQLTSSGGGNYSWSPSNGLSCNTCFDPIASPTVNTIYTLTVTNDSGCASATTITIDITCGNIFVPDAFSPNGDGQNDVLYVRGDCIKTLDFVIFDRWGNKVFETTDQNQPWDGKYNGKPMNTGNYAYYLKATLYDDSIQTKKGSITLIR